MLADGEPQPLRAEAELALRVAQQYRIVEDTESRGPWKVQTAAYSYVVNLGDQELLAYQWNPLDSEAGALRARTCTSEAPPASSSVTSGDCICRPDALPSRMCFASSLRSLVFSRCGRTGPTCSMPPRLAMSAGAPGPPPQAGGDD